MRVSPCGLAAVCMEEAVALARASAVVSHDHPEGIRGAEAVAAAVFLAKTHQTKDEIREYIERHYYKLDFTLDSIRSSYRFDDSCQGSVPQAIEAFLESESFEDAIRNAVSIGGDVDTTGAIAGSIAWSYYAAKHDLYSRGSAVSEGAKEMLEIKQRALAHLPDEFSELAEDFREVSNRRLGTYYRLGFYTSILTRNEEQEFYDNWESPFACHGR